jgi:hypothetical protein
MNPIFFLGTNPISGNVSTYIFAGMAPPPPPPPGPGAPIVAGPMVNGVPIAGIWALPDAGVKCDVDGRKRCVIVKDLHVMKRSPK